MRKCFLPAGWKKSFEGGAQGQILKEGGIMATYITLVRWTQKWIENIKEGPSRFDAAKEAFQAMGAELKEFYLVQGQYDAVVIGEVPDDETTAKLALAIGSRGTIRRETLRAFTEDEYRKIIDALPWAVV